MPYRGTNAKRNVIHDKSTGTIRSTSRDHFFEEKKEHEHEFALARDLIQKYHNDGFHYAKTEQLEKVTRVSFVNARNEEKQIEFLFPDNVNLLKEYFVKTTHQS